MFRVSNFVVGVANAVLMALGLAAMAFSIYLTLHGASDCQNALRNPLLILGVFLLAVSLLGLIGGCCRSNVVMMVYLGVLFLLVVGLIGYSVFVFLVTNNGAGRVVSNRGIKEYRTWDFSNWLRKHFVDGKEWEAVRVCLAEAGVCEKGTGGRGGGRGGRVKADFLLKNISPVQTGCCKPPPACGFELKNSTLWVPPRNGTAAAATDPDCRAWSNAESELCFACDACKAGVLASIRQKWRHLLIFNICLIILTITLYTLACCARRNIRRDRACSKKEPCAV